MNLAENHTARLCGSGVLGGLHLDGSLRVDSIELANTVHLLATLVLDRILDRGSELQRRKPICERGKPHRELSLVPVADLNNAAVLTAHRNGCQKIRSSFTGAGHGGSSAEQMQSRKTAGGNLPRRQYDFCACSGIEPGKAARVWHSTHTRGPDMRQTDQPGSRATSNTSFAGLVRRADLQSARAGPSS